MSDIDARLLGLAHDLGYMDPDDLQPILARWGLRLTLADAPDDALRAALLLELQSEIPGTCDWGGCDNNALLARHDAAKGWLPVCQWHAGDASSADLAPITAVALEAMWDRAALASPKGDGLDETCPFDCDACNDPGLCASCGGRRWVEDQNWTPQQPGWDGKRYQGDGLIPCGRCGDWNTAENEPDPFVRPPLRADAP